MGPWRREPIRAGIPFREQRGVGFLPFRPTYTMSCRRWPCDRQAAGTKTVRLG
jgi:hypothetical protein